MIMIMTISVQSDHEHHYFCSFQDVILYIFFFKNFLQKTYCGISFLLLLRRSVTPGGISVHF